jgi:hypothetical protein
MATSSFIDPTVLSWMPATGKLQQKSPFSGMRRGFFATTHDSTILIFASRQDLAPVIPKGRLPWFRRAFPSTTLDKKVDSDSSRISAKAAIVN